MNTMILAAGKGKRMRPLTLTTPKPLLKAAGKPLIVHSLQRLADAGIRDLVINTAWLGEQIEEQLGNGDEWGVHIRYSREPAPLETLGGLRHALPLLDQGDWVLVVNGDIWTDFDFSQLLPPPEDCLARLVMVDNPVHNPDGDFYLNGNSRLSQDGERKLTFAGVSLLHRSLIEKAPGDTDKLAVVLKTAMAENQVEGIHHQGGWMDVGTPERLDALDQHLRQGSP